MNPMRQQLIRLAQRLPELRPLLKTEEACKNALVMPFIAALGYNVFDPMEVIPELIADVGIKKGEKVDYAIQHEGKIAMLIECKGVNAKLDQVKVSQLYRYFSVTHARIGILTNGVEYWLYSDLEKPNIMDERPFLIFSLEEMREDHLAEMEKLSKEAYSLDVMLDSATNLKYTREIKAIINKEFESPGLDLVKMIFSQVLPKGRFTSENKEMFTTLTAKAIADLIREKVSVRLRQALATEGDTHVAVEAVAAPKEPANLVTVGEAAATEDSGIETTTEEIEGYHIVKSIVWRSNALRKLVAADRIVHRDTKSYMGILLDDNNRKPICRLRFNYTTKYIGIMDADKNEQKYSIKSLDDIFNYAETLIETVKRYEK